MFQTARPVAIELFPEARVGGYDLCHRIASDNVMWPFDTSTYVRCSYEILSTVKMQYLRR
jgi:hypothetical protein